MKVIKRDGREVQYDRVKIHNAIKRASTNKEQTDERIEEIVDAIEARLKRLNSAVSVDTINDIASTVLIDWNWSNTAINYVCYRYERQLKRKSSSLFDKVMSIVEYENELVKQQNSNKNPEILPTQRDYIAGQVSKQMSQNYLIDKDIIDAHNAGIIHFHDMDYFVEHMHNCDLVNLEDMLQNGTVISGTRIDKPHRFSTACNIATQIIAQVASNQYGGQTISVAHLSPFVNETRIRIRKQFPYLNEQSIQNLVSEDIERGIQTLQYQILTLMTTNGQAPFVSLAMYLDDAEEGQSRDDLAKVIYEILRQRYIGVKNEAGVYVTPAFPKLLYFIDQDNIYPDSKYFYVTQMAAKCSAKRMVPDYISVKKMKELKNGDVYPCMGCRSFLTVDRFTDNGVGNIANAYNYDQNKHKYYGRFNQGVVTINLADIGLSANKDFQKFWKIFDERLELCHRALQTRHNRLLGTTSDVAPILWQHGALARLKPGEKIDRLLFNGYSTLSLGYAALYECVYSMTGKSHTDPDVEQFALAIMQHMVNKCNMWKEAQNIDYSLYGTPLESTTYKFAKSLKERFGTIDGQHDRNYVTNSYHVHVTEQIDAFTKLQFESKFQPLSPGGAISYIEMPDMNDNLEAIISVIQYIYDTILYAELNTKSDYCSVCGYDGQIKVNDHNGKLDWYCPRCGNKDHNTLHVSRRTCG